MARLMLDKWPGRWFKDQYWSAPGVPEVYAYFSPADRADEPQEHPEAEMLAIDLSYAKPGNADAIVASMMRAGKPPFADVEQFNIGAGKYLVARIIETEQA